MSNQYPQQPYQQQPYPQQPYGYVAQPSTCGTAIVSLIFGISAYVLGLIVIGAIVAIITGHVAKSQIKNSGGMQKGNGMATAGLALGYIQLGLIVLTACVVFVVVPLLGASVADIFNQINSGYY